MSRYIRPDGSQSVDLPNTTPAERKKLKRASRRRRGSIHAIPEVPTETGNPSSKPSERKARPDQ